MTKIVIYTNTESLSDKEICNAEQIDYITEVIEDGQEIIINDLIVRLKSDDNTPEYIDGAKFIAIHKSAQNQNDKKESTSIKKWRDRNKGVMVKDFSHKREVGTFYKDIIPKVLDSTLTLEDVHKHFPSSLELSLNLLHDIYSGLPKSEFMKDEYSDIFKKSGLSDKIDALDDNWSYSKSNESELVFFRDKLIEYATKN